MILTRDQSCPTAGQAVGGLSLPVWSPPGEGRAGEVLGKVPKAKQSSPSQATETALTLDLNSLRSHQSWSERATDLLVPHTHFTDEGKARDGKGFAVAQPGAEERGLKSGVLTPRSPLIRKDLLMTTSI